MTTELTLTAPRSPVDERVGRQLWQWLKRKRMEGTHLDIDATHVRIVIPYDSFNGAATLGLALDALTAWNLRTLRVKPLPDIYKTGVRYAREPFGQRDGRKLICEEWITAHEAMTRGIADCEDLASWTAAQRRLEGDELAQAIPRPSAAGWHIVVRLGDGSIEDPSAKLGMPTK